MKVHSVFLSVILLVDTKLSANAFSFNNTKKWLQGSLRIFQNGSLMGLGASRAVNMSGPVAEFVTSTIASDTVVIFSKTYCPYCKKAKDVFDQLKQKYTTVELDNREDGSEVQDVLGEMTGARSVPRVFLNGKFIGGGDDVQDLFKKGKLHDMLKI